MAGIKPAMRGIRRKEGLLAAAAEEVAAAAERRWLEAGSGATGLGRVPGRWVSWAVCLSAGLAGPRA